MPVNLSLRRSVSSRLIVGVCIAAAGFCDAGVARAADSVFVLRADATHQGIVQYDRNLTEPIPLASFLYRTVSAPEGRLHLTATYDTLVAQGTAFFEFDADTGMLMRRYPALGAAYGTWAFHGQIITQETAERTGVLPGVYGIPFCPTSNGIILICSGLQPFPDPSRPGVVHPEVLLRRSVEPGRADLSVAKIFPAPDFITADRLTAFDPEASQFLFYVSGTRTGLENIQRVTAARVLTNGEISDETVMRETVAGPSPSDEYHRVPNAFAYHAGNHRWLGAYNYYYLLESRLIGAPLASGSEETLIRGPRPPLMMNGIATLAGDAPSEYTQLLPAVADTDGANGTHWRSDVWFFNPSDMETIVTVERVSDPSAQHSIRIPAKASVKITNAIATLGGGGAVDALIIHAPYRKDQQLSVYSRTFTAGPNGGTYGEAIPAVPSRIGYSNHVDTFGSPGDVADAGTKFILDKRDPTRFRHNIGIVNTTDKPITIRLRYATVSANAPSDPRREVAVVAAAHNVLVVPIESIFPTEFLTRFPPRVEVVGDTPAAVWLSVVDNLTGDASFIPFSLYGVEAPPDGWLVMPVVTHGPGANGTEWRTDLYGFFPNNEEGGDPQHPAVVFHASSTDCVSGTVRLTPSPGAPVTNTFPWSTFWYTQFDDVAKQFCSGNASGGLEIRTGSWMAAWARTYTTTADGGTYGEMLPLFPSQGWRSRHFGGIEIGPASRVNIGLYNRLDTNSALELRLYDSTGSVAATQQLVLAPHQWTQRSAQQLFGDLSDGLYALSVTSTDGHGCWPYVSIVDNVTGDPTNWW